jgi:hypothetical protein
VPRRSSGYEEAKRRFECFARRARRPPERHALLAAEDAARELTNLPLEDALRLVKLYAERGSPNLREGGDAVA